MKMIKRLFAIAIALTLTELAQAQNYKLDGPFLATKSFKVDGACGMCKHRIENTLKKLPAVVSADWNMDSKSALVQYFRNRTDLNKLEQLVAAVGHDTEKFKAPDDIYGQLPDCCHYRGIK